MVCGVFVFYVMIVYSSEMITHVITHRGLDPSCTPYFAESSLEAFTDQLSRGYGIEFDLRFTSDNAIVIVHDANLKRITGGRDEREICSITKDELLSMDFSGSHLTTFDHLLFLISTLQKENVVSAIHLKSASQNEAGLNCILEYLKNVDCSKFYIFDTTIATARYLKARNPNLRIAPSVAHQYDVKRYGEATGGTLLSLDEVLANRDIFDGVWLDEWDLADENGGEKKLYTKEIFEKIRNAKLWIGLVTPELHGTSPGLLGGEAHPDAQPFSVLSNRLKDIVALQPDAICTDYPDFVTALIKH